MRDHVSLLVNGQLRQVSGPDCFLNLSDFLRLRLGLIGTKIVCSEGDCGSCTVLVGRPIGDRYQYKPIDSCIAWMFQLDGTHVVTVEGLSRDGRLTPVQEAMIRCHGSQCGFCTPGFVVAMTGLIDDRASLSEAELRRGLTGNLCRCTGYVPIIEAGMDIDGSAMQHINSIYPPDKMLDQLTDRADESIVAEAADATRTRRLFAPTSLQEALRVLARYPDAKIVAGATDVGVQLNKRVIDPDVILDLNRVRELEGAAIESDSSEKVLSAGARASWTEIESICRDTVPQFHEIVSVFGSPQIRNAGTIGGNIINASPIADSLPFMLVMEAELELASAAGTRTVPITDFYRGYKKLDLQPGELLTRVRVPLPAADDLLRLVKVSRRRDLDIATFTAAIWLQLDSEQIVDARLAFGAVGPTVIRARQTEKFICGRPFDESTMRAAGDAAIAEIAPISDVRGSADFRYQLTRNVLLKVFYEREAAAV